MITHKELAAWMIRRRIEHRTRAKNADNTPLYWHELDNAHAAISATEEPSERMLQAGREKMRELERRDGSMPQDTCYEIWRAMHAAMMAEKDTGE